MTRKSLLFITGSGDQGERGIHDSLGEGEDDATDHGGSSIESCLPSQKEVVDQDDAAVVDNHLAGKKDDSLEGFVSSMGEANRIRSASDELDPRTVVGNRNRCRVCCDDTIEPIPQTYEGKRPDQPDCLFDDEIESQAPEAACSLDVTAPRAKWNIECCSERNQGDEISIGQIQVV